MSLLDNIRTFLKDAALGLTDAVGAPSTTPRIVQSPNGKGGLALVRNGYKVVEYDGPARLHTEHRVDRLDGLLTFLDDQADEASHVIVSTRGLATLHALALLWPTDPHATKLTARVLPDGHLLDWLSKVDEWMDAKAFQELLRTSGHLLVTPDAPDGKRVLSMMEVLLGQVSKAKIINTEGAEVELGRNGQTLARGQHANTTYSVELPEWVAIESPIWPEVLDDNPVEAEAAPLTYTFEFIIDMDVIQRGGGRKTLAFRLRCPDYHRVIREAEDDVVAFIRGQFQKPVRVAVGEPNVVAVEDATSLAVAQSV